MPLPCLAVKCSAWEFTFFLHLTCPIQWKILKRILEDGAATTLKTPGSLSHCWVVNCPERPLTALDSCVNEKYTSVISCPYNVGTVSLTTFDLTNKTILTHYLMNQVKYMMLLVKTRFNPHSATSQKQVT